MIRPFCSGVALLAMLIAAAAAAQVPRSLAPPIEDSAEESEAFPARTTASAAAPVIRMSPVAQPSVEGFGLLEERAGGLSALVWRGSTRDSAEPLLRYLHAGVADPTLHSLATRLLITQAPPPAGKGTENWFALRTRALVAIGEDEKAAQMIASVPASMASDSVNELAAELALLRGDAVLACRSVKEPREGLFWRRLRVVCQAHAGKADEAQLGLDLLREDGPVDPFFAEAVRRMGDKNAAIKSFPKEWSIFDVALLRLAGDTAALQTRLDALPPVAIKYLAQDSSLDIKFREKATARAVQLGLLPGKEPRLPEPPFSRSLASDVTTLVTAFGSGKPAGEGDEAVIARLAVDEESSVLDTRRVTKLLALMEPFGYRVPEEVWRKLFLRRLRYDGEVPPATLVAQLQTAAQGGRKGETIVLACLVLGPSDTQKASDLALLPVVKGLIAAGYGKEARQIAFEAVKPYGGR